MLFKHEVLSTLPAQPTLEGIALSSLCKTLSATRANIQMAIDELAAEKSIIVFRVAGSRGYYAVRTLPETHRACVECKTLFERRVWAGDVRRLSKATTCSRSCAVRTSWKSAEARSRRIDSIKAQRATPEGRAHTEERNIRRWSNPKARERLSDWNKNRWRDAHKNIEISVAIKRAHNTPEAKERHSRLARLRWSNPETVAKLSASLRKTKQTSEYKAKMSASVRERWKDPVWREKWTKANQRTNAIRSSRARVARGEKA